MRTHKILCLAVLGATLLHAGAALAYDTVAEWQAIQYATTKMSTAEKKDVNQTLRRRGFSQKQIDRSSNVPKAGVRGYGSGIPRGWGGRTRPLR